tara:strand:- start:8535 stop:9017 length:483 start_codon:yes stop_codon:yes gene_type:complete
MATYDAAVYGGITRKWFGLTVKLGGDAAAGYTFGTTDATTQSQLARWYPRGPIRLLKAGSFTMATLNGSGVDKIDCRVKTRGASASLAASFNCFSSALFSFASDITMSVAQCKAGEYISITTGTPETDKGTAQNTSTTTGTVAFFVDYVPALDSNWDVNT